MLQLKHKHHLDFPHITLPSFHTMQLSPVVDDDDDELARAISSDPITHEDNWVLGDPDSRELSEFWAHVEDDLRHDPEWFRED